MKLDSNDKIILTPSEINRAKQVFSGLRIRASKLPGLRTAMLRDKGLFYVKAFDALIETGSIEIIHDEKESA